MARQTEDKQTGELFEVKRGRGRPCTGKAMSPAERMRAMRKREISKMGDTGYQDMNLTGLYDWLRYAVKTGKTHVVFEITEELRRRTKENEK